MMPFDPSIKLEQLCRRHGLPEGSAVRFLPLLARAAGARPALLHQAVEFVDRQLQAQAAERASARRLAAIRNEACLRALAPLLHRWRPERAG